MTRLRQLLQVQQRLAFRETPTCLVSVRSLAFPSQLSAAANNGPLNPTMNSTTGLFLCAVDSLQALARSQQSTRFMPKKVKSRLRSVWT